MGVKFWLCGLYMSLTLIIIIPFLSVKPAFFPSEESVYTTIVFLIGAFKMVSTNLTVVTIKV